MPHDPNCTYCKWARFRRGAAKKTAPDHVVGGGLWGWVLGIDYFGPFTPDNDGNVWGLIGVESSELDLGFVELTRDKSGPSSKVGVSKMLRDLEAMGPDPKPVVRLHSDQDSSFQAELEQMLIDEKIKQTNTGGHRPENNAKTEKRIGIILNAFRAMLLTATGGTRYYDLLWGAGLRHANDMVNYAPTSDGKPSPFERRTGMPYDSENSEAYKCIWPGLYLLGKEGT